MNELMIVVILLLAGYPVLAWHLYKIHTDYNKFKQITYELIHDIAYNEVTVEAYDGGEYERVRITRVNRKVS
jgi:hypothetical protein